MEQKDKFVELDWVLVVLVLMMVVLQKLQYVQNMGIVNVLHINLEVLNVVQALEMLLLEVKEGSKEMEQKYKFVEQDKVLVVLVPMMVVLQKLQFVQNMDTVNVQPTNLEVLLVDLV